MPSPLFQNFSRRLKQQAQQQFRNSDYGRLISSMNRAVSDDKVEGIINRYGRNFDLRSLSQEIGKTEIGHLSATLEIYAKRGGSGRKAVDIILKELGPIGDLIKTTFGAGKGGNRVDRELRSAAKLLEAFGYTVLPPKKKRTPGKAKAKTTVAAIGRGIERAREWLSSVGYPVPDAPEPTLPQGVTTTTTSGKPRRIVELKVGGRMKRFAVDHPIVSGKFQRASSTNVHSFAYDIDARLLYVRYKQSVGYKGKKKGKGPLYAYRGVSPTLYLKMLEAPSKGVWIWDQVRERGTLSGHKYDYALVGVERDYVPRKATIMRGGEGYTHRQVLTSRGRTLQSKGPRLVVRPMAPVSPRP